MSTHKEGNEYDIIFCGGGTAACITAGRLAKADPNLSILIIEIGQNNLNDPTVVIPAVFLQHLAPNSKTAIFYKANAEPGLNGREDIVPAGGILGGGSSINFMMYTRAQGIDFDSWKTEGWDAKALTEISRKLETYHIDDDPAIDQSLHGHEGPVNVSFGPYTRKGTQDDLFSAAKSVGEKEIADLQDFQSVGGFSRWAAFIGPDGKRQDTAHRYVHPLMASGNYPNLHLLVETRVNRVIFEGTRATGVEHEPNLAFQIATSLTKTGPSIIKARKLVVVASGALGTPSILERSGVGSKELLTKLEIPVISDLPGVGADYEDHNLMIYPYHTNLKPEDTLDVVTSGRLDIASAVEKKDPQIGWNGIDIAGKLRPSEEEVAQLGPEFKECWNRDFKEQKTKPLMLMACVAGFAGDPASLNLAPNEARQHFSIGCYTAYPYSRGAVHIVSKDASVPPSLNTGFLSKDVDLRKQVWAYKKQREIYRRTNAYAGELAIGHPKFRPESKAAIQTGPVVANGFGSLEDRRSLPAIEYDAEDDRAIEECIKNNIQTTWHSIGTCKMKPREDGGVVDKYLNVYGTQGLKIADLSIPPQNVGANTNHTALIVGEKAAEIIGKELGLTV